MKQVAALPLYVSPAGGVEICLVTTRGSGRWIIPKGHMIDGLLPYESAAREAYEEAGLIGKIDRTCFGRFDYARANASGKRSCKVGVYPLMVYKQVTKWPEMDERKVTRCDVSTALALISVPDLVRLIGDYLQRHHLVANSGA